MHLLIVHTVAALHGRAGRISGLPAASRRFTTAPTCLDPAAVVGGILSDGAVQLRLGAEEAARALPEVGRVAAPVIQSAAEQAADVAQKQAPMVAEKLAAGVEAAKPVLQSTGGTVGKALSGALTPEQLQAVEKSGRVAAQVGEITVKAAATAAAVGGKAATTAAPVVSRIASEGLEAGKQVAPVVTRAARTVYETGELPPDVGAGLARAAEQGSRSLASGAAAAFRGAASLIDEPPPPAPVKAAGITLPQVPSADTLAAAIVRAMAPYALGLGVVAAGLSALRELVEPVERVVKQALALATLAAVAKVSYENWDAIYSTFEVVSGERPLVPRLF